jgi:hypothetical protein
MVIRVCDDSYHTPNLITVSAGIATLIHAVLLPNTLPRKFHDFITFQDPLFQLFIFFIQSRV